MATPPPARQSGPPVRFPRTVSYRTTPGEDVQHEQRLYAALRADRETIARAAAWLRHDAVQSQYAGLSRQEYAFGMASLLDVVAINLANLPPSLRDHAVRVCRTMLGDRMDMPATRRTRRR
jgi:hypothetical protein